MKAAEGTDVDKAKAEYEAAKKKAESEQEDVHHAQEIVDEKWNSMHSGAMKSTGIVGAIVAVAMSLL